MALPVYRCNSEFGDKFFFLGLHEWQRNKYIELLPEDF